MTSSLLIFCFEQCRTDYIFFNLEKIRQILNIILKEKCQMPAGGRQGKFQENISPNSEAKWKKNIQSSQDFYNLTKVIVEFHTH